MRVFQETLSNASPSWPPTWVTHRNWPPNKTNVCRPCLQTFINPLANLKWCHVTTHVRKPYRTRIFNMVTHYRSGPRPTMSRYNASWTGIERGLCQQTYLTTVAHLRYSLRLSCDQPRLITTRIFRYGNAQSRRPPALQSQIYNSIGHHTGTSHGALLLSRRHRHFYCSLFYYCPLCDFRICVFSMKSSLIRYSKNWYSF